ncbi:MAG: hypothetical protein KDA89_21465, partial [Planctomycetaceae bacterium]|nr:hypothetical protein [Planctomycetaceae bacterium]
MDVDAWGRTLRAASASGGSQHLRRDNALIVSTTDFLSSRTGDSGDSPHVVFWGRLDNRDELMRRLFPDRCGVPPLKHVPQTGRREGCQEITDAELVREGWRRWGQSLPEKLLGDFALAVVDTVRRQLFLARDPLGVKPLYYWLNQDGVLFATTPKALLCLNGLSPTVDRDWMARYLLHLSMSHDRTAYEEILKLPGGHHLTV